MIRPLRQRHRRVTTSLVISLPLLLVMGIAARRAVPVANEPEASMKGTVRHFDSSEWQRFDLFPKIRMGIRLLHENRDSGAFAITLAAPKDFIKPDLLIYWIKGKPNLTGRLPANAQLLGAFNAACPLALPTEATREPGVLLLYSLADDELVDTSLPIRLSNTAK